ncbi:MAG: spore coat associated protein CotJA [Bacillota bacterium]|jgi:hypothetical protein|nr:spore coat associated protein CotJA [Bacillota bacterium]MDI9414776.1 spore coat associated protein CotJA [Bacillota bacterium]HOB89334.1 spore coat associated protein CotJA [Bacillota bacterium]HOJ58014.1 spore coat associated protein CotJA [Bacillota bacterium]HOL02821.1 spore coat associated protein CotJA [Bacillota bacterium]
MAEDANKSQESPKTEISGGMNGWELARAYIIPQRYQKIFSPQEGLRKGTIFQELVRPYKPDKGVRFAEGLERSDYDE